MQMLAEISCVQLTLRISHKHRKSSEILVNMLIIDPSEHKGNQLMVTVLQQTCSVFHPDPLRRPLYALPVASVCLCFQDPAHKDLLQRPALRLQEPLCPQFTPRGWKVPGTFIPSQVALVGKQKSSFQDERQANAEV